MENVERFIQYTKDKGIIQNKIAIKRFSEHNRGVIASDVIYKGEFVLSIPFTELITVTKCKQNQICQQFEVDEISDQSLFVLFLISDQSYIDYFKMLPTDLSDFPLVWSKEDK